MIACTAIMSFIHRWMVATSAWLFGLTLWRISCATGNPPDRQNALRAAESPGMSHKKGPGMSHEMAPWDESTAREAQQGLQVRGGWGERGKAGEWEGRTHAAETRPSTTRLPRA